VKHTISIEIDTDNLRNVEDGYLAQCWHVAQANPAESCDREAGQLAEQVGREIIRRWVERAPVELYRHQGEMYHWDTLRQHGKWIDGKWTPNHELREAA
jgi:hypothetical protein